VKPLDEIVIWGAGGHAAVVADLVRRINRCRIAGFIDDVNPGRKGEDFCGARILGGRSQLAKLRQAGVKYLLVAFGDNAARLKQAAAAKELGFALPIVISPSADVAAGTQVGSGTVIASGAVVTPGVRLGENVIINTCASVDHHCVIADGAHICPGVRLAGGVSVGRCAWVGIGATVIDGIKIGEGAMIGAGAAVVRDVPAKVMVYGVPARVIRKRDGK
jgi:UDP-N-acetylbacillosamine N-acetyltransferase